jgi:hypothetical protein
MPIFSFDHALYLRSECGGDGLPLVLSGEPRTKRATGDGTARTDKSTNNRLNQRCPGCRGEKESHAAI